MLQIVRFNWRTYLAAGVICAVTLSVLSVFPALHRVRPLAFGMVGCTLYWTIASLLASHWIYDRSKIYEWTWIRNTLPMTPHRWANIHAGLDESSSALRRLFPISDGVNLDIFDPTEMTEPSIAEARRVTADSATARKADFRALPFSEGELDVVFLVFAAHELRRPDSRLALFKELHRALRRGGYVLLVEHLRDVNNFLAFGPGCFHFQSRNTWLGAAGAVRFEVAKQFTITPFVGVFLFRRPM